MGYLKPAVAEAFQKSAIGMFESMENSAVSYKLIEPGVLDPVTRVRAADTEHSCRVLPGGTVHEREATSLVSAGDSRFVILAVGLSVTPSRGWRLTADGVSLGTILDVSRDPADATIIVWVPRV